MTKVAGRRQLLMAMLGTVALSSKLGPSIATEPVMIFAAATLKSALDAVADVARATLGVQITIVYGPSPALVKQLAGGAAGDLFFSADTDWMNDAITRGIVEPSGRIDLLSSELVLIAPAPGREQVAIASAFPLAVLLGAGRLAMCDPMMMPAGRYGRAALQNLGVWESVKDKVANAADVQATLAYVSRHEAPLGIVFDTDARLDPGVRVVGTFPPGSHPPIVYPLGIVARSKNPDTQRIFSFLASDDAKSIFASHGYTVLAKLG